MNTYAAMLIILSFLQVPLTVRAAFVLRGRRLKVAFAALGVSLLTVNVVAALSLELGGTVVWLSSIGLLAMLFAHPLIAIAVIGVLCHGQPWNRPLAHTGILLSVTPVAVAGLSFGWGARDVYEIYYASVVPVIWLALPLAEATATWLGSDLRSDTAFACIMGITALVLSGPVYSLELQSLGFDWALGAIPASSFAYATLLWAAERANALPHRLPRHTREGGVVDGIAPGLHLLEERRPKHAVEFARSRAASGWPTWVFLRQEPEDARERYGDAQMVVIPARSHAAERVMTTAAAIMQARENAFILIDDVSFLVSNCGLPETADALSVIADISKRRKCVVVASVCNLTSAERRALASLPASYWKLPNLEEEVSALMESEIGPVGAHLLQLYCKSRKMRPQDLRLDQLPNLQEFLATAVKNLSLKPGDSRLWDSAGAQIDALTTKLESYRRMTLPELAGGPWPSATLKRRDGQDWIVRATDFHFGDGAAEERAGVGSKIRKAFADALGKSGETMFEQALRFMQKTERELTQEDLPSLIQTTEQILRLLEAPKANAKGEGERKPRRRSQG